MVVPLLALLLVVAIFAVIARIVLSPKKVEEPPRRFPQESGAASNPGHAGFVPVSAPKKPVDVGGIDFDLPPATHDPELGPPSSSHQISALSLGIAPSPPHLPAAPPSTAAPSFLDAPPPPSARAAAPAFLDAPPPSARAAAPAPSFLEPPAPAPSPLAMSDLFDPPPRPKHADVEAPLALPRDPLRPVVTAAPNRNLLDVPTPQVPPVAAHLDPNATARVQAVVPAQAIPPTFDDPRKDAEEDDEGYTGIPNEYVAKLCDPGADDEPAPGAPRYRVTASANTDRGRRRKRNEDSVSLLEDFTCFAVADGMGGHKGGAEASQMATEVLEGVFRGEGARLVGSIPEVPSRAAVVATGISRANAAIFERAQNDPTLAKMGTTMVVAHFVPDLGRLYIGHVGDSRCYRLRKGHLDRLTMDHTMAEFGLTGPMSGNLSRAVGIAPSVKVDVICGAPEPGDVYLLCSDGLTKMLEDALIHDALDSFGATPEYAVDELVALANARGGRDNVTVVVAYVAAA